MPRYDFARGALRHLLRRRLPRDLRLAGRAGPRLRGHARAAARRAGSSRSSRGSRPPGANADEWVAVRPGGELALALGMAHVILREGLGAGRRPALVAAWTPEAVERQSDVPAATVERLARAFAGRRPSLAVAGGVAAQGAQATALAAAVNLLNHIVGNVGETVRFDRTLDYGAVAPFREMQQLVGAMADGEVGRADRARRRTRSTRRRRGRASRRRWRRCPSRSRSPARWTIPPASATWCCRAVTRSRAWATRAACGASGRSSSRPWRRCRCSTPGPPATRSSRWRGPRGSGRFPASWEAYLKNEWKPLHARFGAGQDLRRLLGRGAAPGRRVGGGAAGGRGRGVEGCAAVRRAGAGGRGGLRAGALPDPPARRPRGEQARGSRSCPTRPAARSGTRGSRSTRRRRRGSAFAPVSGWW